MSDDIPEMTEETFGQGGAAPADERAREVLDVVSEREAFGTWWRMWCPDREVPSSPSHIFDAWLARARQALATPIPASREPSPTIPAGMVAWHGGDSAPADWDGGPVQFRDGSIGEAEGDSWQVGTRIGGWRPNDYDAVAYTPKVAPIPASSPAQGEADTAREKIARVIASERIHISRHDLEWMLARFPDCDPDASATPVTPAPSEQEVRLQHWTRMSRPPAVGGHYAVGGYVDSGGLPRRFARAFATCILTLDGPEWSHCDPAKAHIPLEYWQDLGPHPEAALAQPATPSEDRWRGMESAPKDGTAVDLWKVAPDGVHGQRIADCRWDSNRTFNGGFARVAMEDAWVHTHGGQVYLDGGTFTHWMPLPTAPTGEALS